MQRPFRRLETGNTEVTVLLILADQVFLLSLTKALIFQQTTVLSQFYPLRKHLTFFALLNDKQSSELTIVPQYMDQRGLRA